MRPRSKMRVLAAVDHGLLAGLDQLGRLHPHDVRSSARTFVGRLVPQVVDKASFPALLEDGLAKQEHVKTVVSIFLEELVPE